MWYVLCFQETLCFHVRVLSLDQLFLLQCDAQAEGENQFLSASCSYAAPPCQAQQMLRRKSIPQQERRERGIPPPGWVPRTWRNPLLIKHILSLLPDAWVTLYCVENCRATSSNDQTEQSHPLTPQSCDKPSDVFSSSALSLCYGN